MRARTGERERERDICCRQRYIMGGGGSASVYDSYWGLGGSDIGLMSADVK